MNHECGRKIFAEPAVGVAARYQRRSRVLTRLLISIGLALGGRAGHRLTGHIAAQVSRSTLLRLVRELPVTKER
ncbi:hypothetical protein [Nocardia panacis]|nr:hypothetical protein [Nocardia panacis]